VPCGRPGSVQPMRRSITHPGADAPGGGGGGGGIGSSRPVSCSASYRFRRELDRHNMIDAPKDAYLFKRTVFGCNTRRIRNSGHKPFCTRQGGNRREPIWAWLGTTL
jgi:hypothetical protein